MKVCARTPAQLLTAFGLSLALAVTGCSKTEQPTEGAGSTALNGKVLATTYPVGWLCEQLCGDNIVVEVPLPADADPIFWEPTRADLAAFQAASLIVSNGASFEKWLSTANLPESRWVRSADSFEADFIQYEVSSTHSHGAAGEHTHQGTDGHTWMDPLNALAQAQSIQAALELHFPEQAEAIAKRATKLEDQLKQLHASFAQLDLSKAQLFCSHPAYNYLCRRQNWQATNFDLDPDRALLTELQRSKVETAVQAGAQPILMLWESEPHEELETNLRAVGIQSVLFSPAEQQSAEERAAGRDYLVIQKENQQRLAAALNQQ